MLHKILYALTGNRPLRTIWVNGQVYLQRYFLFELFGIRFVLHRFLRDDQEEHLHNHPWRWGAAFILTGWYQEEILEDVWGKNIYVERYRRYNFNRVDHDRYHRIVQVRKNTWTLMIQGPRERKNGVPYGWGFLDKETANFTEVSSGEGNWLKNPKTRNQMKGAIL